MESSVAVNTDFGNGVLHGAGDREVLFQLAEAVMVRECDRCLAAAVVGFGSVPGELDICVGLVDRTLNQADDFSQVRKRFRLLGLRQLDVEFVE